MDSYTLGVRDIGREVDLKVGSKFKQNFKMNGLKFSRKASDLKGPSSLNQSLDSTYNNYSADFTPS